MKIGICDDNKKEREHIEALCRDQGYEEILSYASGEEQEKGSITPGKLADFIVIDRDIMTCPEDEIKDIQVLRTVIGGETVYKK